MSFLGYTSRYAEGRPTTGGGADPGTPVGDGVNLFNGSKLAGDDTSSAYGWTVRDDNGGSVVFAASALAGHRKVTFTHSGGASELAAIEQTIRVTSGESYTFSVETTGTPTATTPSGVILNHLDFVDAALITARPTQSTAADGEVSFYTIEALSTVDLVLRIGLDQEGVITLEQPMLDNSATLRNYDATDFAAPPSLALAELPHFGDGMGNPGPCGDGLWPLSVGPGWQGWWFKAPITKTISALTFEQRSNRGGTSETNKSKVAGVASHGAYTWDYSVDVYASNATYDAVGSALWSVDTTHANTRTNAKEGFAIKRITPSSTWTITEGDYYFVRIRSRESDPTNTYWSLNSSYRQQLAVGETPPSQCNWSAMYGDGPLVVNGSSASGLSPYYRGIIGSLALLADDGTEIFSNGRDSTPSTFRQDVYGSRRVRQSLTYPWWGRSTTLYHAAWRQQGTTPGDDLTISVTGPGVSISQDISAASVPQWDTGWSLPAVSSTLTFAEQTFQAGAEYIVEFSAPSASSGTPFRIGSTRQGVGYNPTWEDEPIETQHRVGDASFSTDGGSSWTEVGWPTEPWGALNLFLKFSEVAETEGELS